MDGAIFDLVGKTLINIQTARILAQSHLEALSIRGRLIGEDLFPDDGWRILLMLFVRGQPMTVGDLVTSLKLVTRTARNWIDALVSAGALKHHGGGKRFALLELTDTAESQIIVAMNVQLSAFEANIGQIGDDLTGLKADEAVGAESSGVSYAENFTQDNDAPDRRVSDLECAIDKLRIETAALNSEVKQVLSRFPKEVTTETIFKLLANAKAGDGSRNSGVRRGRARRIGSI